MTHEEIKKEMKRHFEIVEKEVGNTHEVVGTFMVTPDHIIRPSGDIESISLIVPKYNTLIMSSDINWRFPAYVQSVSDHNPDIPERVHYMDIRALTAVDVHHEPHMVEWLYTKDYYVPKFYNSTIQFIRRDRDKIVDGLAHMLMNNLLIYIHDMYAKRPINHFSIYNRKGDNPKESLVANCTTMIEWIIGGEYTFAFSGEVCPHDVYLYNDLVARKKSIPTVYFEYKDRINSYYSTVTEEVLKERFNFTNNRLRNFVKTIMLITHHGALGLDRSDINV